ncbi:MAG TPA: hypothetical protein VIM59_06540 [Cellvibrio sp.]
MTLTAGSIDLDCRSDCYYWLPVLAFFEADNIPLPPGDFRVIISIFCGIERHLRAYYNSSQTPVGDTPIPPSLPKEPGNHYSIPVIIV